MLRNSPEFASLQRSAGAQGNIVANRTAASTAARGISGSGIGEFMNQAASGLGSGLQLQQRGQLFGTAAQMAQQNLQNRMNLFGQSFMQDQAMPATSFMNTIGAGLMGAGSTIFGSADFSGPMFGN
jgi:hypothetical protein